MMCLRYPFPSLSLFIFLNLPVALSPLQFRSPSLSRILFSPFSLSCIFFPSLTIFLSLCYSISIVHYFFPFPSLSLFIFHNLPVALSPLQFFSPSLSRFLFYPFSLSCIFFPSLTIFLSLCYSISIVHSLSFSLFNLFFFTGIYRAVRFVRFLSRFP